MRRRTDREARIDILESDLDTSVGFSQPLPCVSLKNEVRRDCGGNEWVGSVPKGCSSLNFDLIADVDMRVRKKEVAVIITDFVANEVTKVLAG